MNNYLKLGLSLGLSLVLFACQAPQSNSHNLRILRFQGIGEAEVQANQAGMTITLNALNPNFKTARKSLLEEAGKLNKLLDEAGVAETDRVTNRIDVNKEYDWTNRGRVFKGYRHTYSMYVTFKDLAAMEEVYPLLLEHTDWNTGYISYSHSNMDSLNQVANTLALEKAKALAENMAEQAGIKNLIITQVANVALSENVVSMRANNNSDDHYSYETMANQVYKSKSLVSIHEGKIKVQRSVNVEFAGE
ncbi:MAG: DUF541 domain-containing protein [Bacteroidetes bacterium]|nr:MAG: DUF541 domain-containing protein [Bacteroidota bacterium]